MDFNLILIAQSINFAKEVVSLWLEGWHGAGGCIV